NHAVRGVSFEISKGETLALVGESGSGKSVTALSILQLLPYPQASHPSGSILFDGLEMVGADGRTLRKVRGARVGLIFQEPITSLNPLHTIARQIGESLVVHRAISSAAARARALELLRLVGIRDPEQRLDSYPHQLSGGQRQRVMIAMALANDPDLLIADEPTTALDVTIQAQILALLKELQEKLGMAILLITHDLGIVRKVADRVAVMTEGEIVEAGDVEDVFERPRHDYTKKLLAAEPKGEPVAMDANQPEIVSARDLKVWFPIKRGVLRRTVGHIKAVDGVTVNLRAGQTVGVVGESGSGKTTLGLALLRLTPSDGEIVFEGRRIDGAGWSEMRPLRRQMQIVFQDPYGSLSPRMTVGEIIAEGLKTHGLEAGADDRVASALKEVDLDPSMIGRYPHEFSGGQRQRIAIA
ncbi:MAG: ATP-binding cassette domain-containing protein, partial [Alphaproteobacteria bacterium]